LQWFDITSCFANQLISRTGSTTTVSATNHETQMLSWSSDAYYGVCFQGDPSYLEAEELTSSQKSGIQQV
jgi:hypothetical protein